jgi:regulatory protein
MLVKKSAKFQKLLDKVYRFLSFRPRSEKEIADYLRKRKTSPDFAQKIFKILREQNLINDSVFAEWWVEQRETFRPKGKIGLKTELRQRGINDKIIEKILSQVDEIALAKKAVQKKIKIYNKLPLKEFQQKISTFLSSRGFSWQTIEKIIDGYCY